jgi:hypothetical protein
LLPVIIPLRKKSHPDLIQFLSHQLKGINRP